MTTAIHCDDCGTTIPHTEPGLTEHVGHQVTITSRPSASDPDFKLRPPFVLTEEHRPRPGLKLFGYHAPGLSDDSRLGLEDDGPPQGTHGDPLMDSINGCAVDKSPRYGVFPALGRAEAYEAREQRRTVVPPDARVVDRPEHWSVGAGIVPQEVEGTTLQPCSPPLRFLISAIERYRQAGSSLDRAIALDGIAFTAGNAREWAVKEWEAATGRKWEEVVD
jgi:hypothetical protein